MEKTYSPETWITIRALYESGQFSSTKALQSHCKKILPRCPTVSMIEKRCANESWDKHKSDEVIEKQREKNFNDRFAALGMDENRRVQVITQGILAGQDIRAQMNEKLEEIKQIAKEVFTAKQTGKNKKDGALQLESFKTEVMDRITAVVAALEPYFANLGVSRHYIEIANKLCGDYAPEKKKVTIKDETPAAKIDELTDDEIEKELSRLKKCKVNDK